MRSFSLSFFCLGALALAAPPTVEVVVSHFHEDLSWINKYDDGQTLFTVYSKAADPPKYAFRLPNVGRESHTYLYHIVRNYNRLAEWSVFTQGVRPSWGYKGGGPISGHLTDSVIFEDYLQPNPDGRDSFFAFSAASHFPSGRQANRLGFMVPDLTPEVLSKRACPVGGAKGWTPWWWDKEHPQLRRLAPAEPSMLEFYHRYIAKDAPTNQSLTLAFAQGARFAVSKARVHSRPHEYYVNLLGQLSGSSSPMQGYWMEAAWFDVFHPEALQSKWTACALPGVPTNSALTIPEMQEVIQQKANSDGLVSRRILSSYTYSSSPTPGPTPVGATEKVAVSGSLSIQVDLTGGLTAASFGSDSSTLTAIEEQLASVTSVAKSDITVTAPTRRLLSGGRRLALSTVTFGYSIRALVDADNNPISGTFNAATISSLVTNMNKATFASAVLTKIQVSNSVMAAKIASMTVQSVSATDALATLPDGARAPAALAVAYLVAALAALVLPLQ